IGGPLPDPPFVTPEIVSPAERPFRTSPEMTPNASPPRPPFVPMSESPPRPPCIVVTQFDEKLGDVYTAAIPAAAPPLPPNRVPTPPASAGDDILLFEPALVVVECAVVVPKEDAPGRVAAVPAAQAAASVPGRQGRQGVGVDRRRACDVEDRDPVRRAAGPAVPGSSAGHRSVSTDAASDVLENVTARIAVSRTDQKHRVRVAAGSAVPVRRPTGSTESPAAAGHSVGRVRE